VQPVSDKMTNSITAHECDVTEVYAIDYYVTANDFKSAASVEKLLLICNEAYGNKRQLF